MNDKTVLDQLRQRVENAVMSLRNELLASVVSSELLPVGDIRVKKTADGVAVKFIPKPTKADAKLDKGADES